MSNSSVGQALDILIAGQDFTALRRALFATVAGHYLEIESSVAPQSDQENYKVIALNALLARLPTCSLASVTTIAKGKTGIKDAVPGPFPLVVTAEARGSSDHFDFEGPGVMIPMVSSTGHGDASLKRVHFQDGQYAVGSILAVVQPKDTQQLSARYLHAYLSAFKDELLVSRMVGTANVSLTVAKIGDVPVPMLPISAQRKVDELMARCDRLEARQANAESAHAQLVQALLDSLSQASDATDFAASWQRLAEHFHTLFTTESSIDALKQTLLQLAVMGKLVPQDPRDEPASELLKRIAEERARLVMEGRIKKQNPLLEIGEEQKPFNVPASWKWVRLGDLGSVGSSSRVHQKDWRTSGVPFFRAREIVRLSRDGFVENELFISEELYQELCTGDSVPQIGDIMLTGVGTIGVPYCVQKKDRFYFKDASVLIFRSLVMDSSSYLLKYFLSPLWVDTIHAESMGTTVHTLTIARAKETLCPLPPLAEQHRIVAKVDELMALCDKLKARLADARQLNEQLADALVEQAVA